MAKFDAHPRGGPQSQKPRGIGKHHRAMDSRCEQAAAGSGLPTCVLTLMRIHVWSCDFAERRWECPALGKTAGSRNRPPWLRPTTLPVAYAEMFSPLPVPTR